MHFKGLDDPRELREKILQAAQQAGLRDVTIRGCDLQAALLAGDGQDSREEECGRFADVVFESYRKLHAQLVELTARVTALENRPPAPVQEPAAGSATLQETTPPPGNAPADPPPPETAPPAAAAQS